LHQNPITSRVILSVNNEQEVAKQMYEKLGFVQYGLGKKEMKVDGKYYDMAQMELIFEDKL
jgi:RimJ/RimL family protein N-acetyltransferase